MTSIVRQLTSFSRADIDYFFAHAKPIYKDPGITILCAPQQQSIGRALFITPRKVGNAPQRNKLRRQLKSIFYQDRLYEYGVDCAFIIRAPLREKTYQELRELCLKALKPNKKHA